MCVQFFRPFKSDAHGALPYQLLAKLLTVVSALADCRTHRHSLETHGTHEKQLVFSLIGLCYFRSPTSRTNNNIKEQRLEISKTRSECIGLFRTLEFKGSKL